MAVQVVHRACRSGLLRIVRASNSAGSRSLQIVVVHGAPRHRSRDSPGIARSRNHARVVRACHGTVFAREPRDDARSVSRTRKVSDIVRVAHRTPVAAHVSGNSADERYSLGTRYGRVVVAPLNLIGAVRRGASDDSAHPWRRGIDVRIRHRTRTHLHLTVILAFDQSHDAVGFVNAAPNAAHSVIGCTCRDGSVVHALLHDHVTRTRSRYSPEHAADSRVVTIGSRHVHIVDQVVEIRAVGTGHDARSVAVCNNLPADGKILHEAASRVAEQGRMIVVPRHRQPADRMAGTVEDTRECTGRLHVGTRPHIPRSPYGEPLVIREVDIGSERNRAPGEALAHVDELGQPGQLLGSGQRVRTGPVVPRRVGVKRPRVTVYAAEALVEIIVGRGIRRHARSAPCSCGDSVARISRLRNGRARE